MATGPFTAPSARDFPRITPYMADLAEKSVRKRLALAPLCEKCHTVAL